VGARTIAIARDAAFAFIYPSNLEVLQALGATLTFFSPLADDPLPACDAVWLPGGYPELNAEQLSACACTRALAKWSGLRAEIPASCAGSSRGCSAGICCSRT